MQNLHLNIMKEPTLEEKKDLTPEEWSELMENEYRIESTDLTIEQKLFNYMKEDHGVDLMESDIQEIKNIILGHESEINKLVTFKRNKDGELYIEIVRGNIYGNVFGNIYGIVFGDIYGDLIGDIEGDVKGQIFGDVNCLHGEIKFIKNPNL